MSNTRKGSNGPSDLTDLDLDLPTTEEDIQALRRSREPAPLAPDWLDQLTRLSEQFPGDVASRRTFEGFEPFEL